MKRQVKKTVQKGLCMLLAGVAVLTASLSLTACVDQHPDSTEGQSQADSVRLVATSQAVAQICDKLELDLVGVCRTSGTLPERYKDVTQVGTAMSPDMEILKSLSPDYVLSPNSLQSDLQPKYASIQVKSLFLNYQGNSAIWVGNGAIIVICVMGLMTKNVNYFAALLGFIVGDEVGKQAGWQ